LTNSRILFFFNHTAPTEIYTLSLHDALPISMDEVFDERRDIGPTFAQGRHLHWEHVEPIEEVRAEGAVGDGRLQISIRCGNHARSEEHTSELQSRRDLVCRLLLEKKKKKKNV